MRTRILLLAILPISLLLGCSSEPSVNVGAESNAAEIVLAIEDEYVEAEINEDEQALRRILADDFVFNSNNGKTCGKEELIKTIIGWNMTGQTISERTIVVEGNTAVIFGTSELRFGLDSGEESIQLLRYTSTYTFTDGAWKFLALHMASRTPST